jgi:hypothetical protein
MDKYIREIKLCKLIGDNKMSDTAKKIVKVKKLLSNFSTENINGTIYYKDKNGDEFFRYRIDSDEFVGPPALFRELLTYLNIAVLGNSLLSFLFSDLHSNISKNTEYYSSSLLKVSIKFEDI